MNDLMSVQDKFKAEVRLSFGDCPTCVFGHNVQNMTQETPDVSTYDEAYQAGIELAENHGGGIVRVIKFTEVAKKISLAGY